MRIHPKASLVARNLRPKKSFGQNFLHDDTHVSAIASLVLGGESPAPRVVELGGGTGALTAALLERGARVDVVERDRDLVPVLNERFADEVAREQLTVHEADAVKFRFVDVLAEDVLAEGRGVLCGNLPYHLTSSILIGALEGAAHLHRAVFLIQREVAERIVAEPGNRTYGLLSVLLAARFEAELARIVPAGAFWPAPEVDGGVLVLHARPTPLDDGLPAGLFSKVVKSAFASRRKTLKNSLAKLGDAHAALVEAEIDPGARAETLFVEDFLRLAHAFAARLEQGAPTEDENDAESDAENDDESDAGE